MSYFFDGQLAPTIEELRNLFTLKYETLEGLGWGPKLRSRFNHFNPDDHYEALVEKMVKNDTKWLDVGSGRFLFPSNEKLARKLSERCQLLVGVDPDKTLLENPFVHEKENVSIENFCSDTKFDLVTFRMVAEHISNPQDTIKRIDCLTASGSCVIIYTIYKYSPIPMITYVTPFAVHHPIKKILWRTESKDTFPVAYKMNTRSELEELLGQNNFEEIYFAYLDDCRTFSRFKSAAFGELLLMRALRKIGLPYPELCVLGVYRKR